MIPQRKPLPFILIAPALLLLIVLPIQADEPVLHEFFDSQAATTTNPSLPAVAPPSSDNTGENEARHRPEGLQSPAATEVPSANGHQRQASLDNNTDIEPRLNYYTVFNPSIVPFKRSVVLDTVSIDAQGEPHLTVADPELYPIEIDENTALDGREQFWASLLIEGEAGSFIPIPSVAPSSRIYELSTNPETPITLWADGAGNRFVQLSEELGTIRLNFVTDAPINYFSPPDIPRGIPLDELGGYSSQPSPLPKALQQQAEQALEHIGISDEDDFDIALAKLVRWFRAFEARPLSFPGREDSNFLDIVYEQRGVCRHRAIAFVVLAHQLGIAAHYVHNEAHAFVEVDVPLRGWLRIDLGGGALGLDVHSPEQTRRHRPQESELFEQPNTFQENYSQAAQARSGEENSGFEDITGLPEFAEDAPIENSSDLVDPQELIAEDEPDSSPLPEEEYEEADDIDPRALTEIKLIKTPPAGLRGNEFTISGVLSSQGQGVPDQHVQLIIANASDRITLSEVPTDSMGHFELKATLPTTIMVGEWDLYIHFPGDSDWQACRSR